MKRILGSGEGTFEISLLGDDRCLCPDARCGKNVHQRALATHVRGRMCRGSFTPDQLDALATIAAAAKARHEKRRRDMLRALHAANPGVVSPEAVQAAHRAAAEADFAPPSARRRRGPRPRGSMLLGSAPCAAAAAATADPRYAGQVAIADYTNYLASRFLRELDGESSPPGMDAAEERVRQAMLREFPEPILLTPTPGPWGVEQQQALLWSQAPPQKPVVRRESPPPPVRQVYFPKVSGGVRLPAVIASGPDGTVFAGGTADAPVAVRDYAPVSAGGAVPGRRRAGPVRYRQSNGPNEINGPKRRSTAGWYGPQGDGIFAAPPTPQGYAPPIPGELQPSASNGLGSEGGGGAGLAAASSARVLPHASGVYFAPHAADGGPVVPHAVSWSYVPDAPGAPAAPPGQPSLEPPKGKADRPPEQPAVGAGPGPGAGAGAVAGADAGAGEAAGAAPVGK